MEDIAKALTEFSLATRLLHWMSDNNMLGPEVNVGETAYQFALHYAEPKARAAFKAAAEIELADIARVAALSTRRRGAKDAVAQAYYERAAAEDAVRADAVKLADALGRALATGN